MNFEVLLISMKFTILIVIIKYYDSIIFSIIIIIITSQLCVFFNLRTPSKFYCPRCQSEDVIIDYNHIECNFCGLKFSSEILESDIDDDNILAKEELEGFMDAFNKEEYKKIVKFLKEDFH